VHLPSMPWGAERFGVTRVARLTRLDRTGVEVAAALRPLGHVLQVSNGKGESFEVAARSAVMEAAELAAAEQAPLGECVVCSANDLVRRVGNDSVLGPWSWPAHELLQAPALWTPETQLAWYAGKDLLNGREVFVPACAVFCPTADDPGMGPLPLRWTSNGMGAHPNRSQALDHALRECLERDTLARALPDGIHEAALDYFRVRTEGLLDDWRATLDAEGFDVCLMDLSEACVVPLRVSAVLLVDREDGPIPVTAGYACHHSFEKAALGALFEAAQSRLTDIQGVREDVSAMDAGDARALRELMRGPAPKKRASRRGGKKVDFPRALVRAGVSRTVVVEIPSEVSVVKVIVPGMRVSELL
jgi:ribosomal protein S12 methylthiotransferase accessory factor